MNYKSQLKAWAIDRVISWASSTKKELDFNTLKSLADELAAYAYVRDEDFTDACKRMTECLKEIPDALEKVRQVQNELAYIEEQMQAQLSRKPANGEAKEVLQ